MVRCASKNGHHTKTCFKEVGLHAQHQSTILCSIVIIIRGGDLYDHLIRKRITLITNNILSYELQKIMRKVDMASIWIC